MLILEYNCLDVHSVMISVTCVTCFLSECSLLIWDFVCVVSIIAVATKPSE